MGFRLLSERLNVLRLRILSKLIFLSVLLSFFSVPIFANKALVTEEAAKLMLDNLGDFRAQGLARPSEFFLSDEILPEDFNALSSATRTYASAQGGAFSLTLVKTRSESAAYALLTRYAAEIKSKGQAQLTKSDGIGTIGFITPERALFFKGTTVVLITGRPSRGKPDQLATFARAVADTLTSEENDIPALVKHLPDWETAQERATYTISHKALQEAVGNRPILDAFDFTGGAEAVTAAYDSARLVIVEFNTPQLSIDNDARITARLKELRDAGQPVPTSYRRVGNYSVFVFDAPDEKAAGQLIDAIKYEKVVQWLGDNPHAWDRLEKEYNETTSGLIIGIVKASGFSALLCVAIGSLFGGLVFIRRRSQQAATDKYSDAGGMLRLNMDELTPQTNPSRLLEKGDS